MTWSHGLAFVYSIAIGLLIGIERERSHRGGPRQALGSRPFALLAAVGTLTALLGSWAVGAGAVVVGFLGYVAVRALGPRRGLLATGLASGFVSATATTASMGRLSRSPDRFAPAVASAQIAASPPMHSWASSSRRSALRWPCASPGHWSSAPSS